MDQRSVTSGAVPLRAAMTVDGRESHARMITCGDDVIRVDGGRLLRIARLDADQYLTVTDPENVIRTLKTRGPRVDLFTFVQPVWQTEPAHPYPIEMDNFAVLPISTFDHWWKEQIGFKARNKAKQAEKKGVVVREVPFDDSLVTAIWQIYNETPIRQGRRFPHYGKDRETVYREEATYLDHSVFIAAFAGETIIGFIKLVMDQTRTQAGLMNIVSMLKHRDSAPTNALVAKAVQACADRGVSRLVYSNFAYGKKQSDSLSDFKERNGFARVDVPRYYVPLTAIGSLAFRCRLHKKWSEHVPESVAARMRDLRAKWHSRSASGNRS